MNNELREKLVLLMTKCSKFNSIFPSMCGLPVNEMGILHIISESNTDSCEMGTNVDIKRIQERLHISKPAISYNLNTLEKKEYIVREIDPKDRRRISVHVTQKGETAWKQSLQQHEDMWNEIMEKFGEADMDQLTQLLARFFDVIDSLDGPEKFES